MSIFTKPHLLNSPRWKNMRVGLLGGSFNPPHAGHMHISLAALKGLQLDAVWWLISPQNPIKEVKAIPLAERVALCDALVDHPKILISDLEKDLGTTITYQSIRALKRYYPDTRFVWISGMDNALGLHKWNNWRDLLNEISMLHLTRSPARSLVAGCPYRMYGRQKHVLIDKGGEYPLDSGVSYWMMQKKMINISSSEIRRNALKNNNKEINAAD
ncbi:MAG: nicotinate-nicotinamide nucleotide adenylyltransferase [Alphaproteobacteria bacterium]|nr:nicotinate-nicotinamide nucleotide adenylyltransferase [Alphaproteobacteria bacterium]